MTCTVAVQPPDDLDAFRTMARRLLAAQIDPNDVAWLGDGDATLFPEGPPERELSPVVPRAYVTLAQSVACHRDDVRWPLLYRALWRIAQGERSLMDQAADPVVHRLRRMATAVKHDQHRMTAFVRFRAVPDQEDDHFIAWYEPQHRVLRRTAAFFIDRFAAMRFSILTPDLTLHWDRANASFAPGLRRQDALSQDAVEAWWERYYGAIFNPARLNQRLMKSHLPARFWRDLPEARVIAGLVNEAGARTNRMIQASIGSLD